MEDADHSLPATTMSATNERPSSANRLPSLNQLAARININVPPSTSPSSASRPRLAAFALRAGGSTTSLASTADSVAVNASTTRSASPASVATEDGSEPVAAEGGDALTAETLEQHNGTVEKRERKVGYKNIPSLDAITARLAKARALSIDGTSKPPDAEMMEDPKTPGIAIAKPEHPLQYSTLR